MRYDIAQHGESLAEVAARRGILLTLLQAVNPRLASRPHAPIGGQPVRLPDTSLQRSSTDQPAWIPTTSAESMASREYDALIIGSGHGGGAMLWRLSRLWSGTSRSIGVIEAGDLLLPTHFYNLPTMTLARFRKYVMEVATPIPGSQFYEIHALGGRTVCWQLVTPRFPAFETASWPISRSELEDYYAIAEPLMNVSNDYQKGSYLNTVLLDRLQRHGYLNARELPVAFDRDMSKYGQMHASAAFSSINLMADALNRKPFDLAVRTRATAIIREGERAAAVRVVASDGRQHIIRAKTIIVCGSSFQTPRLLLNSGIPGPAIGHYLTTHTILGLTGSMSRKQFPELLGAYGILMQGEPDKPYQVMIGGPPEENNAYPPFETIPLTDSIKMQVSGFGTIESRYDNRVELDPTSVDECGMPGVRVHFAYSEQDRRVIQTMEAAVESIYRALHEPGEPVAPYTVGPVVDAIHDAGTCRMGTDPITSVTDSYGQVHGVPGLYIADASVIPTSGTANPSLTVAALSIRTADNIALKLAQSHPL